jgi:hypothetical protein
LRRPLAEEPHRQQDRQDEGVGHCQHRLDDVAVVRGLERLVDLLERELLDQPVVRELT